MANIYDDVESLKQQVAILVQDNAALKAKVEAAHKDSGWITLPLKNGAVAYSANATPKYRKIGNIVFIKGAVKGVTKAGTIGVLPAGYRPTKTAHCFVQHASITNGHANFSRCVVQTDGNVDIEEISAEAVFGADKWFPLHTDFITD